MATGKQQQQIGESFDIHSRELGKSTVIRETEGEWLAYLHMGTGEIVLIPPEHSLEFQAEYRKLNDLVGDYHAANQAVCTLSEYREDNRNDQEETSRAQKALDYALDWRDDAHDALRAVFEWMDKPKEEKKPEAKVALVSDSPLKDAGKQLIELVTLNDEKDAQKEAKKMETATRARAQAAQAKYRSRRPGKNGRKARKTGTQKAGKGKQATGVSAQVLLDATSPGHMKALGQSLTLDGEKVIYIRQSDPNDPKKKTPQQRWPNMKVLDSKGWKDVFVKKGEKGPDGKVAKSTTLDKGKLHEYVKDKAKGAVSDKATEWLKKKLGIDKFNRDHADKSGTLYLGNLWLYKLCEKWNEDLRVEKGWKLSAHGGPPVDIDLTAGAQVMRYSHGMSLDPQVDLGKRQISVRVEGHAELDAARAGAQLTLSFPGAGGWMWTFRDKAGTRHDLVAVRLDVTMGVQGVVGASVAAELSISTTQKVITDPVGAKGSPGKKSRKERRKKSAELKQGDQKVQPAGLEAGVNAFIGAKADGSIGGKLMWRKPGSREEGFSDDDAIASIALQEGVMAGIAGEANFTVEYVNGMFHLKVHAALCFDVGAEGTVTFDVSAKQVNKFCMCIFTVFLNAQFSDEIKKLKILRDTGLKALTAIQGLMSLHGGTTPADYYRPGVEGDFLTNELQKQLASLDSAQLVDLADAASDALKYSLPETRGQCLHAICSTALRDLTTVPAAQRAALAVVKMAAIQPDLAASIQCITSGGEMCSQEEGMAMMSALFSAGGRVLPDGLDGDTNVTDADDGDMSRLDQVALSGDFAGWYERYHSLLAPRWPQGFEVMYRSQDKYGLYDTVATNNDHRLFSSEGWNPYYQSEEA